MKKNIINIFLIIILLVMSGCIKKNEEEPKIKDQESFSKFIDDIVNYKKNALATKSVVATVIMEGIYVKDGVSYRYYSITKLEVMSFEERTKLFYDVEEQPENIYVVLANKLKNFLNYQNIQDVIQNGCDASDGISVSSEVYNVENGKIVCSDGGNLTSIEVTSAPTKLCYLLGAATLDLTGLVVKGNYIDGTTKEESVTLENISGFDTSTTGIKTITVNINGRKSTFLIRVEEAVLESIEVSKMPDKTVFYVGDMFDFTGITITGNMSDGSKKELYLSNSDITGFDTQTAGVKTVSITIGGKSTTISINVIEKVLTGIEITKAPTKTNYYVGESTISLIGLVVTGTYNNGTTEIKTITNSNISGFNTTISGSKTITVTVSGKTAMFPITVLDVVLNSIAVTTQPTKTNYYVGDSSINLTGLVVKGTYNNGTIKTETITNSNISGFNTTTSGSKTITVTVNEKTATFSITVLDVVLNSIAITAQPTKTNYYVGDSAINLTGLVVTGTYNNGTTKTETITGSNISGFNTTTSGSKTITVTVSGKTVTFPITVSDVVLNSIAITTQPTKTNYYVGDSAINLTGLVVKGTYNNGTTKTETITGSNISGFNTTASGSKTITVTVSGKTAIFPIIVTDAIKSASFLLTRNIDILKLKQYSASFEVADSSITTLVLTADGGIAPGQLTISGTSATLSKLVLDAAVTQISVKALDVSGNQVGIIKTIILN